VFFPPSAQSRFSLQENHSELLSSLFLHFSRGLDEAQRMRRSDIQMLFASKAYKDWQKAQENRVKLQVAVIDRIDAVIKSIGSLGRALTRRR
jgi:hypothetical protein